MIALTAVAEQCCVDSCSAYLIDLMIFEAISSLNLNASVEYCFRGRMTSSGEIASSAMIVSTMRMMKFMKQFVR